MKVECASCHAAYQIPDEKIPLGKVFSFQCKKCGTRSKVDLRAQPKPEAPHPQAGAPTAAENNAAAEKPNRPPCSNPDLMTQIVQKIDDLPPMPQVVMQTQQLLADPNSAVKDVATIIESDQAIAAKVLKVANSAYYGMSGKISTIQHASVLLGYRALAEIITMVAASGILLGKLPGYGFEAEDLWRHSLAVALCAKRIAQRKAPELEYESHTAGLIHDVGKIILDEHIAANRSAIDDFMADEQQTLLNAEKHVLGFDHAEIAGEICKKWHIPDTIALAITNHHYPSRSGKDKLSYTMHLADYTAVMSGIGYESDELLYTLEDGTMDFLNIHQQDIGDLTLEIMEFVDNLAEMTPKN
jgi:putative nucleotidyltransferase with HDIG domain/predicted Zn finger-like uncharacterized protein